MSDSNSTAQASYLASLSAAVDTAQNGFFAAAARAEASDQATLQLLMAAVDHTKAAYASALSESLVSNSAFVKSEKTALDNQVAAITAKLTTLQDIAQWLKLLNDLAKLAGSLATAFA
jgi:hypothetical protein